MRCAVSKNRSWPRWVADANENGTVTDLRVASAGSPGFAQSVLGIHDMEDAPEEWQSFFAACGAKILCASFRDDQPVMAFLNERYELFKTSKAFDGPVHRKQHGFSTELVS